MTHPAITAAVTAAREFADAMEAAHAALNSPSDLAEVKVGDVAAPEAAALALLRRLPVGAKVTDRDGDPWTVMDDGQVSFRDDGDSHTQGAKNAAAYAPLTVTYLPETSATPEPDPAPTRVEIRTTDDRDREVFADTGIYGEGSVFISVKDHGGRSAAWLSRDEARRLAATLTAIADGAE